MDWAPGRKTFVKTGPSRRMVLRGCRCPQSGAEHHCGPPPFIDHIRCSVEGADDMPSPVIVPRRRLFGCTKKTGPAYAGPVLSSYFEDD